MVSPDTIVPDPANPQSFNRYTYSLNNPVNLIDPTGHRSCSPEQAATGDETCDENIINYEWLAFKQRMQEQLTGRYGYYKGRKVIFASGPNAYTSENVVTNPSTFEELEAMKAAGEQAVFSLGDPVNSCHPLAAAMKGFDLSSYEDAWDNDAYRQATISLESDVILFNSGLHSAVVVRFDSEDPGNSILIQANQGAHISGIFYTRLGETNIPGIDVGNYVALDLPDLQPVVALATDQTPQLVPSNLHESIER